MPIGTFTQTATATVAATASTTLTHGLSNAPHMVWGVARFRSTVFTTASTLPYFCAKADSASITAFNRGELAETYSVYAIFLHSIVR